MEEDLKEKDSPTMQPIELCIIIGQEQQDTILPLTQHTDWCLGLNVGSVDARTAAAANTNQNNQNTGNNHSNKCNIKAIVIKTSEKKKCGHGGGQRSPITPLIVLTSIFWLKHNPSPWNIDT